MCDTALPFPSLRAGTSQQHSRRSCPRRRDACGRWDCRGRYVRRHAPGRARLPRSGPTASQPVRILFRRAVSRAGVGARVAGHPSHPAPALTAEPGWGPCPGRCVPTQRCDWRSRHTGSTPAAGRGGSGKTAAGPGGVHWPFACGGGPPPAADGGRNPRHGAVRPGGLLRAARR